MSAIVKRDTAKNGGRLIMFFPETYDKKSIEYFTRDWYHGTASYGYYRECKATDYNTPEVLEFVARYERYIRTLPDYGNTCITLVKRIRK